MEFHFTSKTQKYSLPESFYCCFTDKLKLLTLKRRMSDTKAQESVCIEMVPTTAVESEKEKQTNSLEGDM